MPGFCGNDLMTDLKSVFVSDAFKKNEIENANLTITKNKLDFGLDDELGIEEEFQG